MNGLSDEPGLAQGRYAVVTSQGFVGEVIGRSDVRQDVPGAIVDDQRRRIGHVIVLECADDVVGLTCTKR